ncbi:spermatogenesis-defective protein 39 homolog [Neodiprion virginianus]|uniref:spermatogenesis-defective protein 39 homolog n=1 Tax=Neodiprion virginianus TaxID=2961670 RepID=UPI001EE770A4|nr:spermatogenesis-defective protein 39 homolog [Neodiprion virginianus]
MNSAKDDEIYWNTSDKLVFNFEDNEECQIFGVSQTTAICSQAGTFSVDDDADDYLKSDITPSNLKPLLSVISEKTLTSILKAENLHNVHQEKPLVQPDITLRRILLGQPFMLEQYKSLASKTELLDSAIASGDGNAILIVIIFIAKTLKQSLIQRLLLERPEAVNIYIRYLATTLRTNELTDLLTMLGRSKDAAMTNLQIVLKNTPNIERLLQKLQNCCRMHFTALSDCREGFYVQNYIKLLEWQVAVKATEFSKPLDIHSSVLDCLQNACQHHWNASEGSLVSPTNLSKQHDVSPRQYQCVALTTRASMQAWDDIESIVLTKGWLGSKKLQTSLAIEDILQILHENQAPSSLLAKFLSYIDDLDRRLSLAKKLQCHRAVIDIFVLQRDRVALSEYKSSLHSQSEQYFYAENALRASTVKWKN